MKKLLILLCAMSLFVRLQAQTTVNHTTGGVDISLGLYTLQGSSMSFPVTIKYNTSGLKVNDIASTVGLGWSLEGTGAVVRMQHGLPDEKRFNSSGAAIPGGWLQANDCLISDNFQEIIPQPIVDPNNLATYSPLTQTIKQIEELTDEEKIEMRKGVRDMEPDEFYVNAPGLSGKFIFGVDDQFRNDAYYFQHITEMQGAIVMDQDPALFIPYQNCKVTYTRDEEHILSFVITNEHGIQYYFEQPQYEMVNLNLGHNNFHQVVSSWLLTKIEDYNGNIELTCSYEQTQEVVFVTATSFQSLNIPDFIKSELWNEGAQVGQPYTETFDHCSTNSELIDAQFKVRYMRIKEMQTAHEKLSFEYDPWREDSPGDFRLKEVRQYFGDNYKSKVELTHSYFISTLTNTILSGVIEADKKRLKLESLQFKGLNNEPLDNPYSFSYDNLAL
ncbi:MAG: hypothetical protein RLZZ69_2620, partial [Cyanobacteriota bacterium]